METSFWLETDGRRIELRLTHEGLAEPLDIFLVPIARDASGFTYEAVVTELAA